MAQGKDFVKLAADFGSHKLLDFTEKLVYYPIKKYKYGRRRDWISKRNFMFDSEGLLACVGWSHSWRFSP